LGAALLAAGVLRGHQATRVTEVASTSGHLASSLEVRHTSGRGVLDAAALDAADRTSARN
jgi:hypothetical protein